MTSKRFQDAASIIGTAHAQALEDASPEAEVAKSYLVDAPDENALILRNQSASQVSAPTGPTGATPNLAAMVRGTVFTQKAKPAQRSVIARRAPAPALPVVGANTKVGRAVTQDGGKTWRFCESARSIAQRSVMPLRIKAVVGSSKTGGRATRMEKVKALRAAANAKNQKGFVARASTLNSQYQPATRGLSARDAVRRSMGLPPR